MGTPGSRGAAKAGRGGGGEMPGPIPPASEAGTGGRRAANRAAIDAAVAALPVPPRYGALTALAAQFNVPPATIYARQRARRAATLAAPPAARQSAATTYERRADERGIAVGVGDPIPLPDPARCPAPGCGGRRMLLVDPRHMPTLPLSPDLIARAGSLGVCDGTPPHYTWVGTAGSEVVGLGPAPVAPPSP
jgi:hypothetical protein